MSNGSGAPFGLQILNDVALGLSCSTSCFFLLALFLRFGQYCVWWSDSLSKHAYGIYVAHYVFVVWAQYMLLDADISAPVKAAVVFAITLCASWLASAGVSSAWSNYRNNPINLRAR
jgi:surface polysaccharide O-acyltransferase-like enzyme